MKTSVLIHPCGVMRSLIGGGASRGRYESENCVNVCTTTTNHFLFA